jgi:NAD(P)-dependent dehydrogenase (short-subunit alcohol dehydrogenase family)
LHGEGRVGVEGRPSPQAQRFHGTRAAGKVRVNSILPGHTNTRQRTISQVAVFLASDDAHLVTGESLRAAGGVDGVAY